MKTFKKKEVTMVEYNKKMDKIIEKKLPVHETLIKLLQYAGSVTIKNAS